MKIKALNRRPFVSNPEPHNTVNPHHIPPKDLFLHARSFHNAARTLAGALGLDSGSFTAVDLAPVISMYRHALELHLKALVLGEGGNFLTAKPDPLSILKTYSVSWLAQFVCRIVD